MSEMSERGKDWLEFANVVLNHIENYTVPQYGDKGDDLITGYTVADCIEHVRKYGKRYGQQSREGQQELDFLKIAHFVQCAWEKYTNKPNTDFDIRGEDFDLFFAYNTEEENNLTEKGLKCVGSGLDMNGNPVMVFKKEY